MNRTSPLVTLATLATFFTTTTTATPLAAAPLAAELNATAPNATAPNAAEPNAAEPNAAEPNAAEPNAAENGDSARTQFSLHIGVNIAPEGSDLPTLQFADDDAWRMHAFFAQTAAHSEWLAVVDDSTRRRDAARQLTPPPPTIRELTRALERLRQHMRDEVEQGRTVELILTFSGHGVIAGGKIRLALLDGFLSQAFFDDVASWPELSRLHLILDACHAGGVFTGRGFRSEGNAAVVALADVTSSLKHPGWFARRPHVGALLSSSASGLSHEWSRIEGGLFSHEVLSALRGAADVDQDGRVTYDEVAAFSTLAKSTLADPSVAGDMLSYPPSQDPLVALSRLGLRPEGKLRVPARRRIWVRHSDGRSVMHVHTGTETDATLLLPPNVPLVAVDEGDRQAAFVVDNGGVIDLLSLTFEKTTIPRGEAQGPQKGWLQRPFTQDFLDGWAQSSPARSPAPRASARSGSALEVAAPQSSGVASRTAPIEPTVVTNGENDFPVLGLSGLAALAVGTAALSVVSGAWMVGAAAAYNQTDIEVEAGAAAADYSVAATTMVLMGVTAVAAATAGGIWFWSATRE